MGRKKKDKSLEGIDNIKVPDEAPKADKKKRKASAKVSLEMAKGLLMVANVGLTVLPMTREDVLNEIETEALAKAIVHTAKTNHTFGVIINKICSISSHGELGMVAAGIALPRMAKRGIVPEAVGEMAAGLLMLSMMEGEQDVAPGRPLNTSGNDRERENDTGKESYRSESSIPLDVSNETRRFTLESDMENSEESIVN